jgi:acyl-coenzyme A synthetase/AMP-(fatty) acid ligase
VSGGNLVNDLHDVFDRVAKGELDQLAHVRLAVPERFNWASDIFESRHVRTRGSQEALVWVDEHGTERRFTFREVAEQGSQFLNLLRDRGLQQSQTIFVMLPVVPELWLAYFAAIKGGFVLVPAATILVPNEIEYRFRRMLPSAVISDPAGAEKIDQAEKRVGGTIPSKVLVGGDREGWVRFDQARSFPSTAQPATTRSADPLLLFFTSGTTGLPKIVAHTHVSHPVGHLTTAAWLGVRPGDVHYNISQAGWAKWAWSSYFAPWNVGATTFSYHYTGRFVAARHLEAIARYGVTTFCAPPTVWRMLILEDLAGHRFRLRECVSAGEPLNPEVIHAWKTATNLTIRDGYGQTESTLMLANLPHQEIRPGSVGRPTFLYDLTIVDELGQELPPMKEGNIAVRLSPRPVGLFSGYVGAPEETVNAAFHHGVYYTGDRAYRDEEGRFWFVGRADDVIKASDYRIGPFEVESVLVEHPAVAEAAVVASPDALRGARVKAFLILRPGYAPSRDLAKEILALCRQRLAPYKVPSLYEFTTELPKTMSGKIRRVELRTMEAESKRRAEPHPHEFSYKDLS